MTTKLFTPIFILTVLALILAGCQPAGQATADQLSPSETVQAFYTWYIEYINPGSEEMQNPLVDRAYRESPYLSQSKIESVDALLESFEKENTGGYDPFLLAQDIPQSVEVGQVEEAEDSAQVTVRELFGDYWGELKVDLVQQDGRWLIDEISRVNK